MAPANTAGCEPATLSNEGPAVFKLVGRIDYREIDKEVQSNQLLSSEVCKNLIQGFGGSLSSGQAGGFMDQQVLA